MKVKDFCKLITSCHGAETEIVGLVFGPSDIKDLPGGRMKKETMEEFIRFAEHRLDAGTGLGFESLGCHLDEFKAERKRGR